MTHLFFIWKDFKHHKIFGHWYHYYYYCCYIFVIVHGGGYDGNGYLSVNKPRPHTPLPEIAVIGGEHTFDTKFRHNRFNICLNGYINNRVIVALCEMPANVISRRNTFWINSTDRNLNLSVYYLWINYLWKMHTNNICRTCVHFNSEMCANALNRILVY